MKKFCLIRKEWDNGKNNAVTWKNAGGGQETTISFGMALLAAASGDILILKIWNSGVKYELNYQRDSANIDD